MASQLKVTVHFDNEEVQTAFDSQDYQFKDLDAWIRSRFGIIEKESLRYMNSVGEGKVFYRLLLYFLPKL